MNYFRKYFSVLTLIFLTFTFKSFIYADGHGDRLDRIESQVQDALIQIKGMEKKTKDTPSIKAGPGLKIKSGKNEVKFGGRIHYDLGLHDVDSTLSCEMAETEGGSCFTDGTNFRRLRLAISGKHDTKFYYKVSVDWGASAKQNEVGDTASVDEAFWGMKLAKNTTLSIGKQKIPASFSESTSSNDLTFIERAPSVDAMTDETIGPKRMAVQLRSWDKKAGYLIETAVHGSGDVMQTETADEQFGLTARAVYAPIHSKKHVLHLGTWYDYTDTDTYDTTMEWNYRIGLNVSDEKPIDADIGSDLGGVTNMTHWGYEVAYLNNNFWAAGEWLWGEMERPAAAVAGSRFNATSPNCTTVEANMGYAEAGYTFGGTRRYTIKKGGWKRPKVKNPITKGGLGVVEVGIRMDNSSLNGLCSGYAGQGAMRSTTLGVNWQLTNNNRILFNYLMVDLDNEAVDEITSLAPGDSGNGALSNITNTDGETSRVNAIGIRFQSNW